MHSQKFQTDRESAPHLVGNLNYRTPQHLWAAVQQFQHGPFLRVLDLGCNTGLCGEIFKPVAGCLIGVDLSSEMIAVARHRGIYEKLNVAGIIEFLADQTDVFDLILAADVFVYIGDLDETFRRVSEAMSPAGLFAFSVEANSGTTWMHGSTRRYSHGLPYLKQLAANYDLSERAVLAVAQRVDDGKEVHGWIIVLEKMNGTLEIARANLDEPFIP